MGFGQAQLISVTGGWTADRKRTTTMVLQTIYSGANAKLMLPHDAMLAPGVPLLYDFLDIRESGTGSFDERQFCVDKSAARPDVASWQKWYVTCQYSTLTYEQKKRRQHPLDRPATISSTHRNLTRIVTHDINGDPITNSAGYFFDPPIEREDSRKILRITQNFETYNGGFAFQNRINDAPWRGGGTHTLKINAFDEDETVEEIDAIGGSQEIRYFRRVVEIEYNPEGWELKLWDTGTMDKNGNDILIGNVPVSQPVKLDGNGLALDPQTGDAVAIPNKDVFFETNFDSMGFTFA